MGRSLVLVLLVAACGPRVDEPCFEIEWMRALEVDDACDVGVRSDGTIGVLTTEAVLELDEAGETIRARPLSADGEPLVRCRDLYVDQRDRWWATGGVLGESDLDPWLVRLDPSGVVGSTVLPTVAHGVLGSIAAWDDGVLFGGRKLSDLTTAVALSVGPSLEILDSWSAPPPDLGSVEELIDVGDTTLVLAKPVTLDYADGQLLRLDALDQPPAWSRTVASLDNPRGDGVQALASTAERALILYSTIEADPDAPPPEPGPGGFPFPQTRRRWTVDAWSVDGDLEWIHDPVLDNPGIGRMAASEERVLAWLGDPEPAESATSRLFVLTPDGECSCDAAPRIFPNIAMEPIDRRSFVLLGETHDDEDSGHPWLARIHLRE